MAEQKSDAPDLTPFEGPAGGWGSVRSLADILPREKLSAEGYRELGAPEQARRIRLRQLRVAQARQHHPAEFCEEGAKATAWELTTYRTTPEFFAEHTLTELRGWKDYDLEQHGRLTHPLRYDPGDRQICRRARGTTRSARSRTN